LQGGVISPNSQAASFLIGELELSGLVIQCAVHAPRSYPNKLGRAIHRHQRAQLLSRTACCRVDMSRNVARKHLFADGLTRRCQAPNHQSRRLLCNFLILRKFGFVEWNVADSTIRVQLALDVYLLLELLFFNTTFQSQARVLFFEWFDQKNLRRPFHRLQRLFWFVGGRQRQTD